MIISTDNSHKFKNYCTCIKFHKSIFHVFDWQEYLWALIHGVMVGTIKDSRDFFIQLLLDLLSMLVSVD